MTTAARLEAGHDQDVARRPGVLMLLSLPFLLAAIGYGWLWEFRFQEHQTFLAHHLRGILTAWSVEASPASSLHKLLRAAERELWRKDTSLRRQQAVLRSLHRRFPDLFTFIVLDAQGVPIPELCDRPQPKVAWQRVDAAYRKLLKGDSEPFRRLTTTVHNLLGTFIPVTRPMTGTLLRADSERQRRWLFAGAPRSEGWFLVHIAAAADWFSLPLKDRIQRWNRHPSDIRFFLAEGSPPDVSQPGVATAPWQKLWESLEPMCWDGDTLWGLRRVGPRLSLLASRQTDQFQHLRRERTWVAMLLFLLWAMALGAARHRYLVNVVEATSIRLRLMTAVGFAAALPFITIGIVTLVFVREHGRNLEGDLYFRMESALRDMDDLVPVVVKRQSESLLQAVTKLVWPEHRQDVWAENLRRLRPIAPWDLVKVFGPGGHCLFTDASHSSLLWSTEDLGFFQTSARNYLRRLHVKDPMDTRERELSFLESTAANLAESMGKPSEYIAGEERLLQMYLPLMEDGRVTSLLLVIWNRWRLEQDFLGKHLLRFARDLPDTKLLVWNPDASNRRFPLRSPLWKNLRSLFSDIRYQTGCYQGKTIMQGEESLVTAIRSDSFPGSFLLSVTSGRSIRTELRQAIERIVGVGFLLAFGSALAALFFARSILHPIALLGHGIDALKARDFTVRLPQTGRDELGQLTMAFNHMVEGLADLEVAHSVQETLYPSGALESPPFGLCGGSTTQPSLGGQAFDYASLGDQEIGFLVGRCHASGVTAGFALALAKGVLSHPRTAPDPVLALADMERTITPILGEGVPLEIVYGRLNRIAGTICLAGRNPYPPLLVADGGRRPLEFQEIPGSDPLFMSGLVPFPPGARLLLLTGGSRSKSLHGSEDDLDWSLLTRTLIAMEGLPLSAVADSLRISLENDLGRRIQAKHPADERANEKGHGAGWTFLLIERLPLPVGEGA